MQFCEQNPALGCVLCERPRRRWSEQLLLCAQPRADIEAEEVRIVGVLLLDEHDDLVERSGGPLGQPVERVLNDLIEVGLIQGSQRRGGVAEGASR